MSKAADGTQNDEEKWDSGNGGQGVYHVNDRQGRVESGGEELAGAVILERTGLSSEKYELWTIVKNKAGVQIQPTDIHHVKPGNHFRATIRGTDYSCWQVVQRSEPAR